MSVVMPPPPPTISTSPQPLSAKEARADSKAAKARAKALRPWYRKKRFIFSIAILVIIGIVVASQAGSKDATTKSSSNPTATVIGVDKGLGTADASADVTGATIGQPDAIGFRAVTMTVTNNSSKRSNYLIDLSIESPDGATQYDTSIASVNNLEPGQTAAVTGLPITKEVPADAIVTIKTVTRLASN